MNDKNREEFLTEKVKGIQEPMADLVKLMHEWSEDIGTGDMSFIVSTVMTLLINSNSCPGCTMDAIAETFAELRKEGALMTCSDKPESKNSVN